MSLEKEKLKGSTEESKNGNSTKDVDSKMYPEKDRKESKKDKKEKKSKKHKKRRSSSSDSDESDSRSRSRSRSPSESRKKHSKKKKHRSRSRSERRKRSDSRSRKHKSRRSKSRSNSRSRNKFRRDKKRSKSKDNKKRGFKKDFQFDSPPKEMQMTESSIDFAELGIPSLDVLKEMYPALKAMDPTELMQRIQLLHDMKNLQSSKVDRKLYIGNIPPGITPQTLMDLLNNAIQKMGINTDQPGNSIIGAWISPDNHYAFIDFRTPEEATNGFALNSVAIHGQTLKVGRPRSYQTTQTVSSNPLSALLGSVGLPINPGGVEGQVEGTVNTTTKIQPPSRVLVLKNMVEVSELQIDEEYKDILEDIKEECERYGKVLSLKIPRPKPGTINLPGVGRIYVEYSSIDEAKEARKILQGRTFSEHTVEVAYHDEEKYAKDDFTEK